MDDSEMDDSERAFEAGMRRFEYDGGREVLHGLPYKIPRSAMPLWILQAQQGDAFQAGYDHAAKESSKTQNSAIPQ